MAMQETGEKYCVKNNVRGFETANIKANEVWDEHQEWRSVWVEREENPYRFFG